MNRLRLQIVHDTSPTQHDGLECLDGIELVLSKKTIDLDELLRAINATPSFALRLCRMVKQWGLEFESLSDAVVLAGRAGMESLLNDYRRFARWHHSQRGRQAHVVLCSSCTPTMQLTSEGAAGRLAGL